MELKLIDGSLHIYEDGVLTMTTRGNPTKLNEAFTSLEEAEAWYQTTIPWVPPEVEPEQVIVEEVADETTN